MAAKPKRVVRHQTVIYDEAILRMLPGQPFVRELGALGRLFQLAPADRHITRHRRARVQYPARPGHYGPCTTADIELPAELVKETS